MVPNIEGERYVKEQNYFKNKVNSLGGEVFTTSADNDGQVQINQAQELIDKGVKVLVVNAVNMNTAASIVRYAHEHNVKVIAYDRIIKNSDVDYFISFDNVKVGELMAEYIIKLKPTGNYVLIGGDKRDLNAVLVKEGQMKVLNDAISKGNISVIYNVFVEDWSSVNAYQEMKKVLDLSMLTPDAVLSSYDGMSDGCVEALKENGLEGKVLVTGQDAELKACKNIITGFQTMTVYKPLKVMAEKSAELAFDIVSGKKIEKPAAVMNNGYKDVPAILLNPIVVDKNNIKTTVIADGFYTEDEIFN